jgi:LDH2 family malate/lactate/ureidoglycolate dehydrogenase
MPGEIEEQTKARRLRDGIELDANTWQSLVDVARSLSVPVDSV